MPQPQCGAADAQQANASAAVKSASAIPHAGAFSATRKHVAAEQRHQLAAPTAAGAAIFLPPIRAKCKVLSGRSASLLEQQQMAASAAGRVRWRLKSADFGLGEAERMQRWQANLGDKFRPKDFNQLHQSTKGINV